MPQTGCGPAAPDVQGEQADAQAQHHHRGIEQALDHDCAEHGRSRRIGLTAHVVRAEQLPEPGRQNVVDGVADEQNFADDGVADAQHAPHQNSPSQGSQSEIQHITAEPDDQPARADPLDHAFDFGEIGLSDGQKRECRTQDEPERAFQVSL